MSRGVTSRSENPNDDYLPGVEIKEEKNGKLLGFAILAFLVFYFSRRM